jgi:hypothetical protein
MPRSNLNPGVERLPQYAALGSVKKIIDRRARAAFLHVHYHFPRKLLSSHFGVSVKAIRDAEKALESGRTVGLIGRPRALPDVGEHFLVQKIIDSYESFDSLSVTEVLELVGIDIIVLSKCISNVLSHLLGFRIVG